MSNVIQLSEARVGDRGVITHVGGGRMGEHDSELERRLLELGFVEGAQVHLIHQGIVRRDPIALRVDDMTVALRRREAANLTIQLNGPFAEAAE
ncbi:FeoA family protein [Brevundimonas variabilis]|uniref:Ferrous iron transport protein A n=1 Tax=Brevundimonas variabilis TaxID=74312 RepID=A0A7W9CHB2_9CAUL|nr:FeoA family protein [Brevundimonas variabilis]MBB5745643.1 ferrous iron transport protein A [Brevundimonas variabilis]